MADEQTRHKQPLYYGGDETSFPLRTAPYFSRVESQEVDFIGGIEDDVPKNYQFVAFRPGFSLQASELNEMQEHFQMQLTLSISMMHNWITSGAGHLWEQWSPNSLGSEGGDPSSTDEIGGFETSIGQGGGLNTDGTAFHDSMLQVSAPGWRGACPLHPYSSPYQGTRNSASPVGVQYFPNGNFVRLTFWPGWWLTEVRHPWNGTNNNQPDQVSGLKHWVYLNTSTDFEADPNYTEDIPLGNLNGQKVVAGLITNSDYYGCCPEEESTETSPCDSTLADNASGLPNSAACGATRYGVYLSRSNHVIPDTGNSAAPWGSESDYDNTDTAFYQKERLCAVCKVDPVERTVRYMNNLLIARF